MAFGPECEHEPYWLKNEKKYNFGNKANMYENTVTDILSPLNLHCKKKKKKT